MDAVTAPGRERLVGLDVVRCLAVLGMITVHVAGTDNLDDPRGPWVILHQAAGLSAGAFAVSAGVALSLAHPVDRPTSWVPTVVRGLVLFVLGLLVEPFSGGILVILCVYGALFGVAAPLRGCSARTLAVLGVVLAVGWPVVSMALRRRLGGDSTLELSWAVLTGPDPILTVLRTLFLDGTYPVPTWLALALLAWAAHRGGLLGRPARRRLTAVAAGLVVVGFGGATAAERLLHPRAQEIAWLVEAGSTPGQAAADVDNWFGVPPAPIWPALLTAGRHTGTTLEIVQILAVAATVYLLGSVLADRAPAAADVLAGAGRIPLTLYVGHLMLLWASGFFWLALPDTSWPAFVAAVVLWALALLLGRLLRPGPGPLEHLMHVLARSSDRVRASPSRP